VRVARFHPLPVITFESDLITMVLSCEGTPLEPRSCPSSFFSASLSPGQGPGSRIEDARKNDLGANPIRTAPASGKATLARSKTALASGKAGPVLALKKRP
jgi:hypothetical protein